MARASALSRLGAFQPNELEAAVVAGCEQRAGQRGGVEGIDAWLGWLTDVFFGFGYLGEEGRRVRHRDLVRDGLTAQPDPTWSPPRARGGEGWDCRGSSSRGSRSGWGMWFVARECRDDLGGPIAQAVGDGLGTRSRHRPRRQPFWREGRDSNPRGSSTPPTRLAGGRFRPLSHLPATPSREPVPARGYQTPAGSQKLYIPVAWHRAGDPGPRPVSGVERGGSKLCQHR